MFDAEMAKLSGGQFRGLNWRCRPQQKDNKWRTVQMREYTEAVSDLATKSLGKLFVTGAFQKST